MYDKGPDIERMEAAARNGDAKTAFDLAWCYYVGNGVSPNLSEARHWYAHAANSGIREAHEILDILETEGRRISELETISQQWRKAVLPSRRNKWFVFAVLFIVLGGLVGIILYFESPRSAIPIEKMVAQGPKIETLSYVRGNAVQDTNSVPPENAKNDANEIVPKALEALVVAEQTSEDANLTKPSAPKADVPTPVPQKQVPTSVPQKTAAIFDMNDIARQAQKWLDEEP